MATQIVVGDILSARVWCTNQEQAAVNTYNYKCLTTIGGGVDDQTFCNTIDGLVVGFYGPLLSSASTYDGVQTYFAYRGGSLLPNPVKTTISAGAGTTGTVPCPPNTAAIFKYATLTRGPGGRGRLYLPFASIDWVSTGGRTTSAFDVLLNSFASTLLPVLTVTQGGGSSTFVWSLLRKNKLPVPPTTQQIVTAESAGKFGQLHKRGSYGRANASPI